MSVLRKNDECGVALLGALMLIFIFSLFAMVSLQLAAQETVGTKAMREDHTSRHAAEAALQLVMNWFHDPTGIPPVPEARLFAKAMVTTSGQPSFFDEQGRSQFKGTTGMPDILFDASNPQHDEWMNNGQTGWFRSLRGLARILQLKVYGPVHPGLLCTVEVVVAAGPRQTSKDTTTVELGSYSIPPLTAAVQTVGLRTSAASDAAVPFGAHWGDVKSVTDVLLLNENEVPEKTVLASINGQSYDEMSRRQDRWFDLWTGGQVVFLRPQATNNGLPQNLHVGQIPVPGLQLDQWDYETLKKLAISWGSYYGMDAEGKLYPGGGVQPGAGLLPDDVLMSRSVGDHRGLIFIDTLDQLPPRGDNLGTVSVQTEYVEGLVIVNAHMKWSPPSSTKTIPALSPPPEENYGLGLRVPTQLSGINLRGVLYTAGDLTYCGKPRVYGGVLVQGSIAVCPNKEALMEVWYDFDLKAGLHRGLPVIYAVAGTWQNRS